MSKNTLVVITADHGEQFGEHGLFKHGNSLYLRLIHVPLVFVLPGDEPIRHRVAEPVSSTALPGTLLELAGLERPPEFPTLSLEPYGQVPSPEPAPVLSEVRQGVRTPPHEPVSRGDMISYLAWGLHFIRNGDGVEELYDIQKDRAETDNLVGSGRLATQAKTFRLLARTRLRPR